MPDSGGKVGGLLGILTFLGGVALLLLTFKLAYDQFSLPPDQVLKLRPEQEINATETGQAAFALIFKMVMLLVMSVVGTVIANRGIKLYAIRPDVEKRVEVRESESSPAA